MLRIEAISEQEEKNYTYLEYTMEKNSLHLGFIFQKVLNAVKRSVDTAGGCLAQAKTFVPYPGTQLLSPATSFWLEALACRSLHLRAYFYAISHSFPVLALDHSGSQLDPNSLTLEAVIKS